MSQACALILTTMPDTESAQALAKNVIKQRLAACVHVFSTGESYYEWEGELQVETEVQLMIKTTMSHVKNFNAWLKHNHPYDEPEIIVVAMNEASSPSYLNWIASSVGSI